MLHRPWKAVDCSLAAAALLQHAVVWAQQGFPRMGGLLFAQPQLEKQQSPARSAPAASQFLQVQAHLHDNHRQDLRMQAAHED